MLTKDILGQLPGGRVLDLATGGGSFIHFLLDGLPGFTEIIGVDNNERAAAAFAAAFKDQPNIRFEPGDAAHLGYPSESFDLVCISNSLHHFDDPQPVLQEMLRVLRPGGHMLIAEMYCDGQTDTQLTHVQLHHWWAAVDSLNGVVHRETYPRGGLVQMVTGLGLEDLQLHDIAELDADPKDPGIMAELEPIFERYIQRADGHADLQLRGAELRRRVQEIGFHGATTLVALGRRH